jgi:hypothetical protein
MGNTPPYLKALKEIERHGSPGLMEVLREEGIDGVRYALWSATGWHRDYSPPAWRNRATAEQKRIGWEIAVKIERSSPQSWTRPTSGKPKRSWRSPPRDRRDSTGPPETKESRFSRLLVAAKRRFWASSSTKKAERSGSRVDYMRS